MQPQLPKSLIIRGTIGRLPTQGKSDIIRVPSGPELFRSHPQAIFDMIELACLVHPIEHIVLTGPWDFPRYQGSDLSGLARHFTDVLNEVRGEIRKQFPTLGVTSNLDLALLHAIDWGAPLDYRAAYHECMDPRLDTWIATRRDKYQDKVLIVRWPGSSTALLDPRFSRALTSEYRLVTDHLQNQGKRLKKLVLTPHRQCAYNDIAEPDREEARILTTIQALGRWARKHLSDRVSVVRAALLSIDGGKKHLHPNLLQLQPA